MRYAILGLLITACGGASARPARVDVGSSNPSDAEALAEGGQVYAQYCALCHGPAGEGYAADNATRLRGQGLLTTASDAFFGMAIARGRGHTAMAGYSSEYGGPLSDAQINSLIRLIRSWQTEPALGLDDTPAHGDPENGAVLYGEHCASCHGQLGQGGPTAQSLNRWTFISRVSDAFLRHAITRGRAETPMPGFEGRLSEGQIDDIVVFLRRFEDEADVVPQHMAPPSLAQMQVLRHPDGEPPEFTLREGRFVAASQVRDAVVEGRRLILLDARPTSDWLIERLPGALPVPYYDIAPIIARLPRDGTFIVAYCGCPHAASGEVIDALREAGFEHTAVLDEGVYHWIEQGYPTEHGALVVDPSAE